MRMPLQKRGPESPHHDPVDFQIALENSPGRAYTEYVNSVMLTLSTQFYRFNRGFLVVRR